MCVGHNSDLRVAIFLRTLYFSPTNVPSHMTVSNNNLKKKKQGKALSVIAEALGYPNAPTRTCSGDF